MSRVRILNLPKDCTEEQLRDHILSKAPPSAPPLDITDVFIKRGPSTSTTSTTNNKHNGGFHSHSRQKGHALSLNSSPRPHNSNAIRMAFVGFQTAAAGKFVVQYFHRTYFKSSCLHVELAQSVQAARSMLQEKEKKRIEKRMRDEEKEKKRKRVLIKTEEQTHCVQGTASCIGASHSTPTFSSAEEGSTALPSTNSEERRRQFVKDRSAATTDASWTSALLLPDTATGVVSSPGDPEEEESKGKGTEKETKNKKKTQKNGPKGAEGVTLTCPLPLTPTEGTASRVATGKEKDEEEIFERQRALESVSEMDFLSALGTNNTTIHDGVGGAKSAHTNRDERSPKDVIGSDLSLPQASSSMQVNSAMDSSTVSGRATEESSASGHASLPVTPSKKKKNTPEAEDPEEIALRTSRVRLLNIPYVATEQHIKQFVTSQVGPIEGIHIPLTKDTRQSKGSAFIRFVRPEDAVKCWKELHGAIFMGRLVRVVVAEEDPYQPSMSDVGGKKLKGEEGGPHSDTPEGTCADGPPSPPPLGSSVFKQEKESARRAKEEKIMMNMISEDSHQQGTATTSIPHNWNPLYVDSSAAVQQVAKRMQLTASDLVSVDTKGAATRAAIAEALLTSETQKVLGDEGIALEVLTASTSQNLLRPRSATTILVKNIVLRTPEEAPALTRLFSKYGVLELTAFPQSGLFALIRFTQSQDARVAFRRLSFKLFQGAPLYLEWAPVGSIAMEDYGETFKEDQEGTAAEKEGDEQNGNSGSGTGLGEENFNGDDLSRALLATQVFTLYLSNTPFQLSEEELYSFLVDACPRFSKHPEKYVKRVVYEKEKGRAFITLDSSPSMLYAQRQWNGKKLNQRVLQCVPSKANTVLSRPSPAEAYTTTGEDLSQWKSASVSLKKGKKGEEDEEEEGVIPARTLHPKSQPSSKSNVPPGCDPLKLVVKNLPFEATEKDVRSLFSAFSEIRSVRLPRKAQQFSHHRENHHRGFAFVEFLSESEAVRALETLRATHLYGRHLVLEYAKDSLHGQ